MLKLEGKILCKTAKKQLIKRDMKGKGAMQNSRVKDKLREVLINGFSGRSF